MLTKTDRRAHIILTTHLFTPRCQVQANWNWWNYFMMSYHLTHGWHLRYVFLWFFNCLHILHECFKTVGDCRLLMCISKRGFILLCVFRCSVGTGTYGTSIWSCDLLFWVESTEVPVRQSSNPLQTNTNIYYFCKKILRFITSAQKHKDVLLLQKNTKVYYFCQFHYMFAHITDKKQDPLCLTFCCMQNSQNLKFYIWFKL